MIERPSRRSAADAGGGERLVKGVRRGELVDESLGRSGEHVSNRAEELGEVGRVEVAVEAFEALPFLDEDEAVGRLLMASKTW